MRVEVKRSQIFQELSSDLQEKYFYYTKDKFLHNVDTLYYNVFIKDDDNNNSKLVELLNELRFLKEKLKDNNNDEVVTFEDLNVTRRSFTDVYLFSLSEPDCYDIFIASYLPNKNTPRVLVQIRSSSLWLDGFYKSVEKSFLKVKSIFEKYNCEILCSLENRFDYAYHTNAIQNPLRFFSTDNLMKTMSTSLKTAYQISDIFKSKSTKRLIDMDGNYLGLGSRNSNNCFVRIYNKTKEVIEMNYKAFFIEIWYQNKMISFYDKYCLEYAYKENSYNALDTARLLFYQEFGSDDRIKREISLTLDNINVRHSDIVDLADKITPRVTLILNIEFETKRKFYYSSSKQIDSLPCKCEITELSRLYKIYQNRNVFLDFLTSKTVSFVKEFKIVKETVYNYHGEDKEVVSREVVYASWWKRLRRLKLKDCNSLGHALIREYSRNLDLEKSVIRAMNTISSTSIYRGNINSTFVEDVSDFLGMINDNDLKTKDNEFDISFICRDTGLIIDDISNKFIKKYDDKKSKKYRELKNRIPSVSPDPKNS